MTKDKNHFIFTDCDLDGAGSYLMWPWFTGKYPDYRICRCTDFDGGYKAFLSNGGLQKYDRIFILDLDVSRSNCIDLIDNEKVTIIDHHKTHVECKDVYKHAKTYIEEETSCTKLIYKLFSKKENPLTDNQKLLIAMIDDYDSYQLKIPQSYHINLLFWNYQGDRLAAFLDNFKQGYRQFTDKEKNVISFYLKKLENIKNDLDVHTAYIPINDNRVKFVSVFADQCINEVADHIIKNYKADIGIVINLKSNKVSLRKSKTCPISLTSLGEKIFDETGGHADAVGGILCDKFLTFSKVFKPMKIKVGT